jgi:hypothetical protein
MMPTGTQPQAGQPLAESTFDTDRVTARAGEPDGAHYEADPDQIVKVVHQVKPATLPIEGPADPAKHGPTDDASMLDVRVTPETASVHEALPPEE